MYPTIETTIFFAKFVCMGSLSLHFKAGQLEAGCDEAGRGCLAGPVVAGAVILPDTFESGLLNDSKKLTKTQRNKLRPIIEEEALAYAVSFVYPEEIDKINILNASFTAMHRAVNALQKKPEFLLIDGNRFNPHPEIKHACIIKGDSKFLSIAAASILAKTYRDEYMESIAREFPHYDWGNNKGYPTQKHRDGIRQHGPCKHHRKSFTLLPPEQLELF